MSTHRFVSISMAHHMPTLHLLVYYGIVGKVTFIFQNMQSKAKENLYKVINWLSHKGICRPKAQLLITPLCNEPVASLLSLFIKNDKGKNEQKKLAKATKPAVTDIPTTFFYPKIETY